MIRIAIAQIRAHRVRLALTITAVMLGVAFVSGSLVLNDTAQKLFDQQFRTAAAGADLTVRTATAFDSGMGVDVERDPISADVVQKVASVEGVSAAVPVGKGTSRLERDGVDLGAAQLTTWIPEPIGAYPLLAGTAPDGSNEVAVDKAAADALRLQLGDHITLVAERGLDVVVVGLVGFGDADGPPLGMSVLASLPTAQNVLGLGEDVSEILVTTERTVAELQPVLARELGTVMQVATAQDLATAGAESAAANLQMLQVVLIAMALAALVIGSFLIANTFSIVISQRTRELAIVRAAGATGGQVLGSVLLEAVLVGIVASAVGVVLGIVSTFGLRSLARTFGVSIPDGDLVIQPITVILSFGIGVLVTVVAALGPARRAARVSPVVAIRSSAVESRRFRPLRVFTATALLTAGGTIALLPTFGAPMVLLAVGLALALVGFVLLAPVLMRPLVRLVAVAIAQTIPARLARDAAARAPRRTAVTAMALAFGLALMSFVVIVGASVKDATGEQYREVISADAVIESAGQEMLGGVHAAVYDEITALDEVGVVTRLKYGHWKDGDATSALTAVDPVVIGEVAAISMRDGVLSELSGGGIVIAERVADDRGLRVGDQLPMLFARTNAQQLPIVGIMANRVAAALQTDYVISLDTYREHYAEDMDASIFVLAAHGISPDRLSTALEDALTDHPTAQVRDQAAVIAGRTQAVDQIFGLVTVLLAFAMVIAVLGIANTLALSIVERTREIGLLRAVGMSRRSVAGMVQMEAVIVSVISVALGLGIGFAASFAAIGALSTIAPLPAVIPGPQLVLVAAVVACAGTLAGIAPAWRAARLPVLEAIGHA
ncbi:putative ABC transport system permease protein [Paramicrobacterium humi]|uniref:Putative ABC transport system permease protein n=1 Tax=Paramicrobacterium humi TaxID=640635 RepID=A0A1H4NVC9_9MICO|nr:FtsX-like permease family protein [Microbacterium humi]SEB99140.1 putative ABC transport system permease protein [Microbacterium humi]